MDKRILKKPVCLLTLWVFLLSQLAYAGLYEDILGLPSSRNMPRSYERRSLKVEQPPTVKGKSPQAAEAQGDGQGSGQEPQNPPPPQANNGVDPGWEQQYRDAHNGEAPPEGEYESHLARLAAGYGSYEAWAEDMAQAAGGAGASGQLNFYLNTLSLITRIILPLFKSYFPSQAQPGRYPPFKVTNGNTNGQPYSEITIGQFDSKGIINGIYAFITNQQWQVQIYRNGELYEPEYPQIEPTGIGGWLGRNAGSVLKSSAPPQVAPTATSISVTPTPISQLPAQSGALFVLPTKLGEYDNLDVSIDLDGIEYIGWHLTIKTPNYFIPLWFYDDSQLSEELKSYLQSEQAAGQKVSHLVIYNSLLVLNEPKGYLLVITKGDIELKGKEGLQRLMPISGPGRLQFFNGREVREGIYLGTYQDAIRDIQNGSLTGIIHQNGKFTWRLLHKPLIFSTQIDLFRLSSHWEN